MTTKVSYMNNLAIHPLINNSFPSRSCWGPTLECLGECQVWCLLLLARCERQWRASMNPWSNAHDRMIGHQEGQRDLEEEHRPAVEWERRNSHMSVTEKSMPSVILWINRWDWRRMMWWHFSLTVPLSSNIWQRLFPWSNASIFLFFFKIYQHN